MFRSIHGTASTALVFDSNEFRGAMFARALQSLVPFADVRCRRPDRVLGANETADLGLFVPGGRSLCDSDVASCLAGLLSRHPDMPMIALCDRIGRDDVDAGAAMGLQGVIPTDFNDTVAIAAFHFVLAGGQYFPYRSDNRQSPALANRFKVLPQFQAVEGALPRGEANDIMPDTGQGELTRRQTDVLRNLRQGFSNKEIARNLDIAEATVKIYVRQLLRKFDAQNRTQIVVRAESAGADLARRSA